MKAILVVELPEEYDGSVIDVELHSKTNVAHERYVNKLKPMPQKKDENAKLNSWELTGIYNAESRGYNKCLDEILGEEE